MRNMNEEENIDDNMAHSHIEHSDPKEKEEHKKQSEKDLGTVKTVRKVTEHPELRWWFNAITVKAHNQNNWWRKQP